MPARRTPLYDAHDARGARFTDFGGWEMPVEFDSIRAEHEAVRNEVGIFDVSHMGQVEVAGADARRLCQRLTTADVDALATGEAQYTTIPDEDGTMLDDALLYRLEEARYLLVPNAGHDEEMTGRWTQFRDEADDEATVTNETEAWGMLAIQGPDIDEHLPDGVPVPDRNTVERVEVDGTGCWVAGTGYTGERGIELLVPWEETETVESTIDGTRCGLGARDTLRLEMGYVLAGNEFDREDNRRTPYEARLDFAVALGTDPPCVGHDRLAEIDQEGPAEVLCGLILEERGIPRAGYDLTDPNGETIGQVTSGTMSPTLGEPIGLGYVDAAYAEPNTEVGVVIRGTQLRARIVSPPFVEARQ